MMSPNSLFPRRLLRGPFAPLAVAKPRRASRRFLHSSHIRSSPSNPASVALESSSLRLTFPSGNAQLFPYTWLRDSDPALIHPHTRQKLHSTVDIPVSSKPMAAELSPDGAELTIQWDSSPSSDSQSSKIPLPPTTTFSLAFLERQSSPASVRTYHHEPTPTSWTRETITSSTSLFLPYDSLMSSDSTLLRAVSQLSTHGLLFVQGVPTDTSSSADTSAGITSLASRLGAIRETFYGRTWDVKSLGADSRNVAYTDLDLGLHIDLEYFEHPPRYQILHMLRCRGVIGGESIFADAFHAAYELGRQDREAFDTLTKEMVAFHYENDGHHLYREHPTIQLAPPRPGELSDIPSIDYVNYSPPFQAPLPLATASNPRFLPALQQFAKLLTAPESLFEYRMEEGEAVIFDNRRVLHGRREFKNATKMGGDGNGEEGTRWLKGCYLEAEGILDRMNVLKDRELAGLEGRDN